MRNRNGKKGFTLIELLIVIAIIGILAAVLIPNLMRARRVAVDRAAQGYAQNTYTAYNAYAAEHVAASALGVVGLDGDCADGTDLNGEYTTPAPSFDVTTCVVAVNGTDFQVTLDYTGGVDAAGQVIIPQ